MTKKKPGIFIGLALASSGENGRKNTLSPCLFYIPKQELFLMGSVNETILAVEKLCSHYEIRFPEDYEGETIVDEISNGRLIQTEPTDDVDESSLSNVDDHERTLDFLIKRLTGETKLELDDSLDEDSCYPEKEDNAESKFLEEALSKMKDQQQVEVIRRIFRGYSVDTHDCDGEKLDVDSVLSASYHDSFEIESVVEEVNKVYQNWVLKEDDFTYSLEDIPPEIVDRYQLNECPTLMAQISAMTKGVDNLFRKIGSCYEDDALEFEGYHFMRTPPKSESEIAGENKKEAMKLLKFQTF